MMERAAVGIRLIHSCGCCPSSGYYKTLVYKYFILLLTFFCYTAYHLSRKPISVVKPVLRPNDNNGTCPTGGKCGWPPFNGDDGKEVLGSLDYAYLFSYALAMFISGHVAERMDLRYFLACGMILSGLFTAGFGFAFYLDIHNIGFFIAVQIVGGVFQSTGWPAVVACVGNWFGKAKRGFIFGVWNAHTSVGNILGSVIAASFVSHNWGLSFIVPGIIIAAIGFIVFLVLVPDPDDIGCEPPDHAGECHIVQARSMLVAASDDGDAVAYSASPRHSPPPLYTPYATTHPPHTTTTTLPSSSTDDDLLPDMHQVVEETVPLLNEHEHKGLSSSPTDPNLKKEAGGAISILGALKIPGVIEFSLCLLCAKLVSYTFLYWLPTYIKEVNDLDADSAGYLSTLFDVGGIIGGIFAGILYDKSGAGGSVCVFMLLLGCPMLWIYYIFSSLTTINGNIALLMALGFLVNGPYALITTAVSASLGTHETIRSSSRALATVTAIIDGTGSIGAALGPLLAGIIPGWRILFIVLITCDLMAAICISRVMITEVMKSSLYSRVLLWYSRPSSSTSSHQRV